MSFFHIILVFCIIYAFFSIAYKWYTYKKESSVVRGIDFLKSIHPHACGVIFINNAHRIVSVSLQIRENDTVTYAETLQLLPEGGKLTFITPVYLQIQTSENNFLNLFLDKPHHEYTIVIEPDNSLYLQ